MYKWFALIIICCSLHAKAQVLTDPAEAFSLSKSSNKPVLLIFSGSDWCLPCIQFNKKILNDSSFQKFAADKLVILEADFPQRKKIAKQLRTQYDALAEKYNHTGEFPKIVLLNKDANVTSNLLYTQQSCADFISELKKQLPE